MVTHENILALDYGAKRVGVAVAHPIARMPHPLSVLTNDEHLFDTIAELLETEAVGQLVVGLPRNMDGSIGPQAQECQLFGKKLQDALGLPVAFVDETLSSVSADAYIAQLPQKGIGLDAVAAAVILERYFTESTGGVK